MIIILSYGPYLHFMNCECLRFYTVYFFIVQYLMVCTKEIHFNCLQRKILHLHRQSDMSRDWRWEKTVLNGTHEAPHKYTMVHMCTCGASTWSDFAQNLPWPSLQYMCIQTRPSMLCVTHQKNHKIEINQLAQLCLSIWWIISDISWYLILLGHYMAIMAGTWWYLVSISW